MPTPVVAAPINIWTGFLGASDQMDALGRVWYSVLLVIGFVPVTPRRWYLVHQPGYVGLF